MKSRESCDEWKFESGAWVDIKKNNSIVNRQADEGPLASLSIS
jgi:hypothetical protein